MDDTCCPMWNYMDIVLFNTHDYSWPQSTSDYPYCQIFGCNPGQGGYCAAVGL